MHALVSRSVACVSECSEALVPEHRLLTTVLHPCEQRYCTAGINLIQLLCMVSRSTRVRHTLHQFAVARDLDTVVTSPCVNRDVCLEHDTVFSMQACSKNVVCRATHLQSYSRYHYNSNYQQSQCNNDAELQPMHLSTDTRLHLPHYTETKHRLRTNPLPANALL